MLPFAALIAVVAIGQTLVIQQGGLDLSIPGAVTLGALIVAKFGTEWDLATAIIVAILGTSLFGVLSGVVIAYFGLPPLVVTIAEQRAHDRRRPGDLGRIQRADRQGAQRLRAQPAVGPPGARLHRGRAS